jgi:hypothetical protein
MSRQLRTDEAARALRTLIEQNARAAADENVLVAREEEGALHPFLRRVAGLIRQEGGPGARVYVDALVERAVGEALAAWARHNPPENARDAVFLALDEIAAVERDDPDLGDLTRQARALALGGGVGLVEAARAWFDAFDWEGSRFSEVSLPEGRRVDARVGQPGRVGLPASVLGAFDFYYRAEQEDFGSASLHHGRIGGHALWAVYTSTDGDEAFLEVLDEAGATVTGARFLGGGPVWDEFPGRVRLAALWVRFEDYDNEEGYSEPEEREAEGQPPQDWAGEVRIDQGTIAHTGGLIGPIDLGDVVLTPTQRAVAFAAFEHLWGVHLRHTVPGEDRVIELGPRRQGVLVIGAFKRPTDGETYQVADWRDIDDGSFVLYFEVGKWGPLLRVEQFDN